MRSMFYDLLLATRPCLNLSSALNYHQSFPQNGSYVRTFVSPKLPMQFFTPSIEIFEGKKVIDYRLSVQAYVADETHN